jgi:transcriptional regulator with XRE-family HTH domain
MKRRDTTRAGDRAQARYPYRLQLGAALRKARLRSELTAAELAAAGRVSKSHVHQIERGFREPSVLVLIRMFRALQRDARRELLEQIFVELEA